MAKLPLDKLTSGNIDNYFESLGWPKPVRHERIVDARHDVHRVETIDGRHLVIKHGIGRTDNGDGLLLAEGLAYISVSRAGVSSVPRCILHDRGNDILVLEDACAENLHRILDDGIHNECLTDEILVETGRTLARFHRSGTANAECQTFDRFDDLVPSAAPLSPETYAAMPAPERRLIAVAQSDELVALSLERVRSGPADCLIHGDMRTSNVLIDPGNDVDEVGVMFVDLELLRVGDPIFDLGTLVASILESHLCASGTVDSPVRLLQEIIQLYRRPLRALLAGYFSLADVSAIPWAGEEAVSWRLGGAVGAHLLHRAAAYSRVHHALTNQSRVLAILACHILRRPHFLLRELGVRPAVTPQSALAESCREYGVAVERS